MNLSNKRCVPCEGGIPKLKEAEIQNLKKEVDDSWKVIDNYKISRDFNFDSFNKNIDFVNQVARIAEEEQHHPNMCISYDNLKIEVWTHAIDGLSENDFILAAKIDELNQKTRN